MSKFATHVYNELAVKSVDELVFGKAKFPVTTGTGLVVGGGDVYPEVNFTLPPMNMTDETYPEVLAHYKQMGEQIMNRAVKVKLQGIMLEFELLPMHTERPEWGAECTKALQTAMHAAHEKFGIKTALRATIADVREKGKPPVLRSGKYWEIVKKSFEACADAGADGLSIESVGGKEVHDKALVNGDIAGIVFALGVLSPRDMTWIWEQIRNICEAREGVLPYGDSACGFANTALALAEGGMLPRVLAGVDRAMVAVRALAAHEQGALGPSKDCAYESPYLKAIAGVPITEEGKSAACAHFTQIGNISSSMCDLWSNESVQNVRLLSGNAPECYTETLAYDCRLMNTATAQGKALILRDMLVESDVHGDPQAAVISPAAAFEIATAVVNAKGFYKRTIAAGLAGVGIIKREIESGKMKVVKKEQTWLARIEKELKNLPETPEELAKKVDADYGKFYDKASYGL
jgi:methanol--5-hydroxybenzimidazolylcobamide Co-methyltransferase